MKNETEIEAAMEEAIDTTKKLDQDAVNKAMSDLQKTATEQLGPQTFVKGRIDIDNGGVLVTLKRPSLAERYNVFVKCDVVKPERKSDEPEGKGQKGAKAKGAKGKGKPAGNS